MTVRLVPKSARCVRRLLILLVLVPSSVWGQSEHINGKWGVPFLMRDPTWVNDPGEVAIHMLLLRGRSDSTHVLYWTHGYSARLMLNAVAGSSASHFKVPSGSPLDPDYVESLCAGHSTMAGGTAFVGGGLYNITAEPVGTNYSATFDAANYGSPTFGWTRRDDLPSERYYPSCLTLATGEVLIVQGDQYQPLVQYGGISNEGSGDQVRNTVDELAVTAQAPFWKTTTVNLGTPPTVQYNREGHTCTWVGGGQAAAVLFGGRSEENGPPINATQGIYPEYPTDSTVLWVLYDVEGELEPPARAEHSAASFFNDTYVFGGQGQLGQARDDLWHLNPGLVWNLELPWNQPPSARWGHSAIMDPNGRMLVFGGQTDSSSLATNAVHAFTLSTRSWREVVAANSDPNAAPPARKGHVAIWDPAVRSKNGNKLRMVLFGGESSSGYLNDAWVLERAASDTNYLWRKLDTQGNPAPRSRAAVLYDEQREQLLVIGGDSTYAQAGGQSNVIWALPLRPAVVGDSTWRLMPATSPPSGRAGHAVALEATYFQKVRTPDRFNPHAAPGTQWTPLSWAPKLMPFTYPFVFTIPNNKVFWAGPNGLYWNGEHPVVRDSAYILELDPNLTPHGWRRPGIWNRGGDTPTGVGWWGGSAVLYHVDANSSKVMKCGGNHNWGEAGLDDSSSTYSITLNADGTSAGWTKEGTAPDTLLHRRDHNLIVLPTGKVLVVGGAGVNSYAKAQIWDPATGKWSQGLDEEPVVRNYHSAAVLLPDARVLCGGGRPELSAADAFGAYRGTIYEPPYLFKESPPGSYATRPGIGEVVQRIRYGSDFVICLSTSTTLSSVSLIRPGAATHGFDQNQRYVPLSIRGYGPGNTRVTVSAPADSFIAPPGDYMLFIVNSSGVPSIARWMRVGSEWNEGDFTPPATVADLDADAISSSTIYWIWTVPGDNGSVGQPWQHKLVHSSSPITSTSFANSNPVPNLPVPDCVGSQQGYPKSGLAACTYYYAAIQAVDESNNFSGIGYSPAVRTLCGGGGGGGASATVVREEGRGNIGAVADRRAVARAGTSSLRIGTTSAGLTSASAQGVLVAEHAYNGETTTWTIYRADPSALGGAATLDPSRITFQERDGAGGWRTRRELPDLPVEIGLRSLKAGRVVLPASYELRSIETRPPGFDLTSAQHSRLGDLSTSPDPDLAAGDTIRLAFSPSNESDVRGEDCFFIAARPAPSEFSGRGSRLEEAPLVFALHQNQPNPFERTTRIGFSLPAAADVKLVVFDLLGRRVRTLANASFPAGEHEVRWDRRTTAGSLVHSGLYFYSIEAGPLRAVKRMVVLP